MKIKFVTMIALALVASGATAADKLKLDDLFPTDRVLDVQITVEKSDWDTIRHQRRDLRDALSERRKESPIEGPYTYVNARVTIDGVDMGEVGIRKKGFIGSQNSTRPSLKIKLDHVDKKADIGGLSNLTLNNNQQDITQMSQFLGYGLFNAAGSPAPRCSYAKVTVNGESLGVYSHVESFRKPLLKRAFGSDKGTLYEGTVVDFFAGWENSFEHKTGKDKPGRQQIQMLTKALEEKESETILSSQAMARAFVPTDDRLPVDWTSLDFDDSDWIAGRNGAGYETERGFGALISPEFDFTDELHGKGTSICVRIPFEVEDLQAVTSATTLAMLVKYDDGFIAYLNGHRIASANAPENAQGNSTAIEPHDDKAAIRFESFDISNHKDLLRQGKNILAIQGLNVDADDDDMLLVAKLQINGTDFEKAIGKLVDLDAFYRFWAVEGLLGFWDGYSGNRNNFFVYLNPKTEKFHFLPWGADCMFEKYSQITRDRSGPLCVKTTGLVAYALYQSQSGRQRYADTLQDILDKHWNEEWLLAEIGRIEMMLEPHLIESQRASWKVDQIREFVRNRRSEIAPEIAGEMPLLTNAPGPPPVIPDFDRMREQSNADTIWNAAKGGDLDAVKKHLGNGIDVDVRDPMGATPLSIAALAGHLDIVNFLIAKGADVDAKNPENSSPLHGAAFLGQTKVVQVLIAKGADMNVKNVRGETPLNAAAAQWDQVEGIVRFVVDLVQVKVDMEQVRTGRIATAKLLRENGGKLGTEIE